MSRALRGSTRLPTSWVLRYVLDNFPVSWLEKDLRRFRSNLVGVRDIKSKSWI